MCLAIPAQVVAIVDAGFRLATVDIAGVRRTVNYGLVGDEVSPGDWLLVHVGFALSRVDEAEADATLRLLRGMGQDFDDAIDELKQSAA